MKWNYKLFITSYIILFQIIIFTCKVSSQTRDELDRRKKENLLQLQNSRGILEKMTKTKETSLNQINLIQKNILLRQELIDNISQEIKFSVNDINLNNEEIVRSQSRIETLKNEYAELIRNSYKIMDIQYGLMYILSAEDINQGYARMKYLKYMTEYRKNLINELDLQISTLLILNKTLSESKIKNEQLLNERKKEMKNLDADKSNKIKLVKSLQSKEAELKKEILRRENMMKQIENEISKLIEEEARRAREARGTNILSEVDMKLASEFSKNQGKLPWPTEKGIITGLFGEQNHPVLQGIKIKSNGVDISTVEGSNVRAVFNGIVSKVIAIMGANYTVIIRHGDFYTVYQNLVQVKVKSGDNVKTGELLGTVFTGPDSVSKIHFEIWKERKILNPELWLRK